MTSEEIKSFGLDPDDNHSISVCNWLQEIAFQLAVMNEHNKRQPPNTGPK